ncbi:exodeoxyribonuclease VII large subunit [Desulfolucanica intricata]|uniref:exodeoxyribonuclease VII large subunit n=1 Tax=Desulfolucanica intricata TaxID=1285191 RepID=UPI001A9A3513|nr:exodeoxyribonuclease VII large subunit [Desulfolucanica intricata]
MVQLISVRDLNAYIKDKLENDTILSNVWVKGEISNYKRAASGHLYFTLKDAGGAIKTVMFRSRARSLLFSPENGMSVIVVGYVSVYEQEGLYQLYANEIQPDGIGTLYIAFEQLKDKLGREGLFEQKFKKNIPAFPKCIGIVTSPVGAALRDMVKIIWQRWPGVELIIAPTAVQGSEAPHAVAFSIKELNKLDKIDVIIVGRGGGSLEELWAFNTEIVARSIFKSTIPIISAVGHETDYTIADMVADVRAATPSAAAEMVVPNRREILRYISLLTERLKRAIGEIFSRYHIRLNYCYQSRVFQRPIDTYCKVRQQELKNYTKQLYRNINQLKDCKQSQLAVLAGRLHSLSPLDTLSRGYSVCTKPGIGRVITDASEVEPGDYVNIILNKGKLYCVVNNKAT